MPAHPADGPHRLRMALRGLARRLGLLERGQVSCCGVTLAQCHALQQIGAQPGLGVGELAARLGVDPSTASRVVEALVRSGWVKRAPVPGDRRTVRLSLTPSGVAQLERLEAQAEADAASLWEALPAGYRDAVVEALEVLLSAMPGGLERRCPPPPGAGVASHAGVRVEEESARGKA